MTGRPDEDHGAPATGEDSVPERRGAPALDPASPEVRLLEARVLRCEGVVHGFTTRQGGVSGGPFRSLNLGLHVTDRRIAVLENRHRVCRALGIRSGDLVAAQQVHGSAVAVVTTADRGRGARDVSSAVADVDGLITADADVPLLTLAADCVPVLLADPIRGAVGVMHAGWRGTVRGAVHTAVRAMVEQLDCRAADIRAAIGPSIGPRDYVVGSSVTEAALACPVVPAHVARRWIRRRVDGRTLDLWRATRDQLLAAGVRPDHIERVGGSTADPEAPYYSHRSSPSGITGRHGAIIVHRGDTDSATGKPPGGRHVPPAPGVEPP